MRIRERREKVGRAIETSWRRRVDEERFSLLFEWRSRAGQVLSSQLAKFAPRRMCPTRIFAPSCTRLKTRASNKL